MESEYTEIKERLNFLNVLLCVVLGLVIVLIMGTNIRVHEFENELAEMRNEICIKE